LTILTCGILDTKKSTLGVPDARCAGLSPFQLDTQAASEDGYFLATAPFFVPPVAGWFWSGATLEGRLEPVAGSGGIR
jgi:hypothetical protein